MRSQSSHNSEVQNFWKLLAIYFATTLVIFWLHPATALKKNLTSYHKAFEKDSADIFQIKMLPDTQYSF
jgi:hypothetical protein